MHANNLNQRELFEFDPQSGVIRFAGQRALLLDAVAMGLLRKYLADNVGLTATRAVLSHFGFAHGWRMAEAMKSEFPWDSDEDWRLAGPRIHSLEGLFSIDPRSHDVLSEQGLLINASYEAEQHLLHFGRSEHPACWTICGLASGYVSRASGEEIYVLEDHCLSQGEAACRLRGRTREQWGSSRERELRFFDHKQLTECLDISLRDIVETLKDAEKKVQKHRRTLGQIGAGIAETNGLVAKSGAMLKLLDLARRIAKVDSTVVITGESGVGKERIARLIHDESPRAGGPFIAVSCGAISETLLESELFGHARGAFTGANQDRPGLFEAASGGTLFLDEVGEVSAGMQVKLLRALQEREIRRVGENQNRPIDIRLVAATNRDLTLSVAEGTFRQDLYYRLRVVELHVPPLRERHADILPLARVLLAEAAMRMSRSLENLTSHAADQLLSYEWPGNVRELENAMERAVALAEGTRVEVDDLPPEVRNARLTPTVSSTGVQPLGDVVKSYILASLEANGGNQTQTAKQLEIGAATLYRKLKSYGRLAKDSP